MLSSLMAALLLLTTPGLRSETASFQPTEPRFPASVADTEGNTHDIRAMVQTQTVVVVTLKATWCPVCQEQLVRLKSLLPRVNTLAVSFLVLAPGPRDALRRIREKTAFPYPFIEDRDLNIARELGLLMSEEEIMPTIFILDRDRGIDWIQRGRNEWYYGDPELLDRIGVLQAA